MNDQHKPQDWRQRLDEHESPLDPAAFWQGLEPRLAQPRRKRRFLFWWWTGALGLVVLLAGIWGLSRQETAVQASRVVSSPRPQENAEVLGTRSASAAATGSGAQAKEEPAAALRSEEVLPQGDLTPPGNRAGRTRKAGTHAEGVTVAAMPRSVHATSEGQVTDIETWLNNKTASAQAPATTREDVEEKSAEPRVPAPPAEPIRAEALEPSGIPLNRQEDLIEETPSAGPAMVVPPRPAARDWSLWAGLYGGAGWGWGQYSAPDAAGHAISAARQATERELEAWSAGLELRLYAPGGFFLHSGLQWQRLNQRYDQSWQEEVLAWGLAEGYILNLEGSRTPWSDSTWQFRSYQRTVRHYNLLQTLDIPLALGYRVRRGPWSGDLALGTLLNLRQYAKGRSSAGAAGPIGWGEAPSLTYRHRLGLGLLVQTRLAWSPGEKMALFLQPQWSWHPASRLEAGAGYALRFHHLHLQAGVAFPLR